MTASRYADRSKCSIERDYDGTKKVTRVLADDEGNQLFVLEGHDWTDQQVWEVFSVAFSSYETGYFTGFAAYR